jgi:heavy metal sensor kinase
MTVSLRPQKVRTRLALWYVAIMAGVLLVFWGLTAVFLFLQLRSQLDHYAIQDVETIEGLLHVDTAGHLALREDYHNHPESKQVLERFVEVRSADGSVLYRNERLGDQSLGAAPLPGEGEGGYSAQSEQLADGTRVRRVSRRHVMDGSPLLIRLAYSEEAIWTRVKELAVASLLAFPVILGLAGLSGYLLAKGALAPLGEMARRAERITSERLDDRLPMAAAGDELAQLARVFNALLARLEQSFEQLKRFTADASHELRTPLTAMRSVGEVALQRKGSREEYRDTIGSMLEEVNRLTGLVDNLLTISRADAGRIPLNPTSFSAMAMVRDAAGLFEVLIEEKGQQIVAEGDESVLLTGDRVFLRQALVNIIHNAVKYSPAGGLITVRVSPQSGGQVCVEVADAGPGISPEHSMRIFDRFYRVDESRSREIGGAGLGLSIAQWAVKIHGGEIILLPTRGSGCTFQISLPAESITKARTE